MVKTVALDFDGVLHSYESGWQGVVPTDPPVPGAQQLVAWLLSRFKVVIFSTRANTEQGARAIERWLEEHSFPPVEKVSAEKPIADLYVDDRAYRFDGHLDRLRLWILDHPELGSWVDKEKHG